MNSKNVMIDEVKSLPPVNGYALVYRFSSIELVKVEDVSWDFEEWSEAYLFNDGEQIHVFRDNDELKAVKWTMDVEDTHFVDRTYNITGKFRAAGNEITIRDYLSPDEDGQAVVSFTKLVSVR